MLILLFSVVLYCEKEEINQEGRRSVVNALEVEYLNPDPVISLLAKPRCFQNLKVCGRKPRGQISPIGTRKHKSLNPPTTTTTTDPRKGLM